MVSECTRKNAPLRLDQQTQARAEFRQLARTESAWNGNQVLKGRIRQCVGRELLPAGRKLVSHPAAAPWPWLTLSWFSGQRPWLRDIPFLSFALGCHNLYGWWYWCLAAATWNFLNVCCLSECGQKRIHLSYFCCIFVTIAMTPL